MFTGIYGFIFCDPKVINSILDNKVNGYAFEIVYNDQYNQFGIRLNEQTDVVHTINGVDYSRIQAVIHSSGRVFVQALPVGETTWTSVSEPRNVTFDYSNPITIQSGQMTVGQKTYTMTTRGFLCVCNMYALTLGTTSTTNSYHMMLFINNHLVGDSQSYTPYERGGSMYAFVNIGDVVRLSLERHDVESCTVTLYEFKS